MRDTQNLWSGWRL